MLSEESKEVLHHGVIGDSVAVILALFDLLCQVRRGRATQQAFGAQVFVELGPMDAAAAARAALHSSHGHTSRRNCQE